MKHIKNVFLVLVFAMSTVAFSASAIAASDTKAPQKPEKLPPPDLPGLPKWCKDMLDAGGMLPPDFYKICFGY
ncbi:hypothetical protein GAG18_04715 [Salmonella enterica]|nr:hypothetical protein [Salmonella enterica]ECJ2547480.1 hypothetical protein [Salmonella enterica subsp. arizonae]EAX0032082.1 hypothetical protein [Salmonella enterica]EBA5086529.1 hypothetical protein [Salmonella enterica]EDC3686104.1 hypothetical protein [Salmonella enterica]